MKNNEHQGHVFWRLMSYLKPYKWLTFFALLFLLSTTVIKSFVPLVASYFIDHFLTHFNQTAASLLLGYYLLYVLQTILQYFGNLLFARVSFLLVLFATFVGMPLPIWKDWEWPISIKRQQVRLYRA